MAEYNVSKAEAKRLGIERVKINSGSSSSSSSGNKKIGDTSKEIDSDAEKAMSKLSPEAQAYILEQDFGGTLKKNEVEKYNNKWIEADKVNKAQGSALLSGMLPENMQNKTIANLSEDSFKTLIPTLMPGTPEYQAAMDKLSTAYFDVMEQQMNAQTEQEQIAAEYNWQTLKKTIETNLNVTLSDDAYQAWDEIQSLKGQYGQQGLAGSGIQNESIDDYLNKARRVDATARSEKQTKEEASKQDFYLKFATPEQIKELVETNPEQAKAWGLIPSDEIRLAMSAETLKAKNPTMSDQDIQRAIASVVDENGNYRSSLYQKYMVGDQIGVNQGNVDTSNITYDQYGNATAIPVKPSDSGILDIQRAKELYLSENTPLEAQNKNYQALVDLGAIQPTSGEVSGTAAGTQFNEGTTSDPNTEDAAEVAAKISESLSNNSSGSSSSSGSSKNERGNLSKREYKAQQAGGILDYDTGKIKLPDGSLL